MRLVSFLLRDHAIDDKQRQARIDATEKAIEHERGRLHGAIQNIESGTRVLETMSGMITILKATAK